MVGGHIALQWRASGATMSGRLCRWCFLGTRFRRSISTSASSAAQMTRSSVSESAFSSSGRTVSKQCRPTAHTMIGSERQNCSRKRHAARAH